MGYTIKCHDTELKVPNRTLSPGLIQAFQKRGYNFETSTTVEEFLEDLGFYTEVVEDDTGIDHVFALDYTGDYTEELCQNLHLAAQHGIFPDDTWISFVGEDRGLFRWRFASNALYEDEGKVVYETTTKPVFDETEIP